MAEKPARAETDKKGELNVNLSAILGTGKYSRATAPWNLWVRVGIVGFVLAFAVAPPLVSAQETSIVASDLFDQRDLDKFGSALSRYSLGLRWLPYSADYRAAHASEPEDPGMRPEFAVWLKALLAPQWLLADLADSAVYLRVGAGRESRYRSCFYSTYETNGTAIMIKGYLDRIEVTIKPTPGNLLPAVAVAFGETQALNAAREAGKGVLVSASYDNPSKELQRYLRGAVETYINPISFPSSEAQWTQAISQLSVLNGGFDFGWSSRGFQTYAPQTSDPGHAASYSLWTNGRILRITVDHSDFWIHSFKSYFDTFPQPRRYAVIPLNPQAVELWETPNWEDEGGPVSDPQKADRGVVQIVAKPPYGPEHGLEEGGRSDGATIYGVQVKLPLSPLKWQIAEFGSLSYATLQTVQGRMYEDAVTRQLAQASDRAKLLAEAKASREACNAAVTRFAALYYPSDVRVERDAMLTALTAAVRAWDGALTFWTPIVETYPDASESFYLIRGESLSQQLADSGLGDSAERVQRAANAGLQLYKRFGLQ